MQWLFFKLTLFTQDLTDRLVKQNLIMGLIFKRLILLYIVKSFKYAVPLFPITLLSSFRDNIMLILCSPQYSRQIPYQAENPCTQYTTFYLKKKKKKLQGSFDNSISHIPIQTMGCLLFRTEFLAVFLDQSLIIFHLSTLSLHLSPDQVIKTV